MQSCRKTSEEIFILAIFYLSGCSGHLFLYFRLFNVMKRKENLPMTGFESQISGVGSDCSTNLATTAALLIFVNF